MLGWVGRRWHICAKGRSGEVVISANSSYAECRLMLRDSTDNRLFHVFEKFEGVSIYFAGCASTRLHPSPFSYLWGSTIGHVCWIFYNVGKDIELCALLLLPLSCAPLRPFFRFRITLLCVILRDFSRV